MKNLTIPIKFDLKQFLQFFAQLSPENKALIFNALKTLMTPKPNEEMKNFTLQGSVLKFDHPFEPLAAP